MLDSLRSVCTESHKNLLFELLHLLRDDLFEPAQGCASLSTDIGMWWATHGRRAYPAWSGVGHATAQDLFDPLPQWPRFGAFGMTAVLQHLLQSREDLRSAFDTDTDAGLWQAIAWFFTHGLSEYALLDMVDAPTVAALDAEPPFFASIAPDQTTGITWLMFFVWRSSASLQDTFDLRSNPGRLAYQQWFWMEGVSGLRLAALVAPRWLEWLRQPLQLDSPENPALPRAALLLLMRRTDLQQAFDVRTAHGIKAFAQWTQAAWQAEPALKWIEHSSSAPASSPMALPPTPSKPRPHGVNLIGFAFGELGIGEDVRMAAAACEAAGIPYAVVNISPGSQLRQADLALAERVAAVADASDQAPYCTNVFCLTGFDTARVFLERGLALFAGRYNIGWWPWELPVWPKDWRVVFDLVDEVWAATEFTQKMYTQAQSGARGVKPVTLMPLPASVGRVKTMTRRLLGLPARQFLFLYIFDFNSYLARKNPFAAIKAFKQAFGSHDQGVGLVLKTMNSNPANKEWKRFVRECAQDGRITLLDKTLDRGEVLGLVQACDAYVSLHRSEGFGRTLAEAMLFGKPVVGTDFSGNVDFLTPETGFPVRWKRRKVRPGEYPFVSAADAAWWAEPDTADAARQLLAARQAAKDKAFGARIVAHAQRQFSVERIGQVMKNRLKAIDA